MPTPLSLAPSLSAVTQTLARVEAAAEYCVPYTDAGATTIIADHWNRCMRSGDIDGLIASIRRQDIVAYRHLDEENRAGLKFLALRHPELRARLQEGAAVIERSIGVALPLRLDIFGAFRPEHARRRGLALFFDVSDRPWDLALPLGLQMFQVGGWDEDATPPARRLPGARLTERRHSEVLRGHFAADAIKTLGALEPAGRLVVPLLSPSCVFLGPELTRIGRFTFLGLSGELGGIRTESDLNDLMRFRNQVDVLVLGGAAATAPGVLEEFVSLLRPRVTLAAGAETASVRTADHRMTALFEASDSSGDASGPRATLEIDPTSKDLTIEANGARASVAWEKEARLMEILEGARAAATKNIFGNTLGDRRAWRWSQATMNGVVGPALNYMLLLEANPHLMGTLAEREEALAKIIGRMTERLTIPDADVDHVAAFKELLLQSGLLDRRDGP